MREEAIEKMQSILLNGVNEIDEIDEIDDIFP